MIPAAQALLAELEAESAATRRLLERVPADRLGWKPHEKSMTLGQLAHHLAGIPGRLCELARQDGMDARQANFTPPQPESAESLVPTFEASLSTARDYIGGLDEESAAAIWRMTAGDREIFAVPRLGFLRTLVFNHSYHHRGQLTVYLRLLGVDLPATYGRSADETPFDA